MPPDFGGNHEVARFDDLVHFDGEADRLTHPDVVEGLVLDVDSDPGKAGGGPDHDVGVLGRVAPELSARAHRHPRNVQLAREIADLGRVVVLNHHELDLVEVGLGSVPELVAFEDHLSFAAASP